MGEGVKAKLAMIRPHPALPDTAKRKLLNAVEEIMKKVNLEKMEKLSQRCASSLTDLV